MVKKNIQLLIFLAQVKGMGQQQSQEWHSGNSGGTLKAKQSGYPSHAEILSTFLKQLERNSPGAAGALQGESHGRQMSQVWLSEKKNNRFRRHQIKLLYGECLRKTKKRSEFHLQTNIQLRLVWTKTKSRPLTRSFTPAQHGTFPQVSLTYVTCPTHSGGTKTTQTNEYLSFKQPVFPPFPFQILCVELL